MPPPNNQQQSGKQPNADFDKIVDAVVQKLKGAGPVPPWPPFPSGPPPGMPWPPHHHHWPPRPPWPPVPPWPPIAPITPAGAPAAVMWAWLMSWLLCSGMPYPNGARTSEAMWEFAATRDDFWRHMADAMADVFQQAANASHFVGEELEPYRRRWWPPGGDPNCPPIDIEKLRADLGNFSQEDQDRIVWAVQCWERFGSQVERNRKKGA